jgi:hypothetical protein
MPWPHPPPVIVTLRAANAGEPGSKLSIRATPITLKMKRMNP